jgi:gentisate 1,2-dioxygenase
MESTTLSLEDRLVKSSLWAHWLKHDRPRPLEPWSWKWTDIHDFLVESGKTVSMKEAKRRTVQLVHPTLGNLKGTSRTLQSSFQLVNPGETAEAHRHTAAALRFVVQGHGAYTTVEGEQMVMEPGDLILTPNWTWHDHHNDTNEPIIWMDGLDIHLTGHLNALFQQNYDTEAQPIAKKDGYSKLVSAGARPIESPAIRTPPYNYKWSDTVKTLEALAKAGEKGDPCDGIYLEYKNLFTGGHTMPTIGCYVQMLRPGEKTAPHRHTSNSIYQVFSGDGVTVASGKEMRWGSKDCFFIPSWSIHTLENTSKTQPAFLFSMTDRPVTEALGLYREDRGPDFKLPSTYMAQPSVAMGGREDPIH